MGLGVFRGCSSVCVADSATHISLCLTTIIAAFDYVVNADVNPTLSVERPNIAFVSNMRATGKVCLHHPGCVHVWTCLIISVPRRWLRTSEVAVSCYTGHTVNEGSARLLLPHRFPANRPLRLAAAGDLTSERLPRLSAPTFVVSLSHSPARALMSAASAGPVGLSGSVAHIYVDPGLLLEADEAADVARSGGGGPNRC